ncbi:MAG: hypothetical protein A2X30_09335 [Elusimicrobia bacterium GWB2_63_16]|nr:MAG: hypothetical protein A2X30_09335 [Elusimicrobia bacterium GWB2_63_16]
MSKNHGTVEMKGTILIIDPVLTGTKIAQEAKRRGFNTTAVIAWREIPSFAKNTFSRELYDEVLELEDADDLGELISSKVKSGKIRAVFPGTESAVELAERARALLGFKTNNPGSTQLRRNKYRMHMALRKSGLRIPAQIEASSFEEILGWIEKDSGNEISWPVVVKPLQSAGTDGLSFSSDLGELRRHAESILASRDMFGNPNTKILAQSFVPGTEYVVNTISSDGRHRITDFWRYTKRTVPGAGMIYDRQDLLPVSDCSRLGIQDYVFRALDSLEVRFGPAHSEVMMTGNGPVLIETASRIQGGINTELLDACTGTNQLSAAFDVALNESAFDGIRVNEAKLNSHACWINLICGESARVRKLSDFQEKIRALKSCFSLYVSVKEGQLIPKTIDLMSCPGVVFLMHDNPGQIEDDYLALRKLEKEHY